MNGSWMELPINIWIDKEKIKNRMDAKDTRSTDWLGNQYNSLCITADSANVQPVLVSEYTEDKQVVSATQIDYVQLKPTAELHLPRNREVQALNRLMVMWNAWDKLIVVAR